MKLVPANVTHKDLLLELMKEYYAHDHLPLNAEQAAVALDGILGNTSFGRVWLVEDNGETAGYVVLTLGYSLEYLGHDAFIDEIYLREACRGKGFGKQIVAFLEEQCRNLQVRALHLEVEYENKAAQAFYRKTGFDDHARYLMSKLIR